METQKHNTNNSQNKLLLALLAAVVMAGMIYLVYHINVPNPNMILITVMVFFTGIGGMIPGAVAAVMMLLYSMFFFSTDGSFIHYTEINFQKILVIVFGIVMNFLVVGILKKNRDKAQTMLMETNKYLLKSNEYLTEKVDTAERIAELSESVNSLLTNMPAMTFSKDINTGKYLACNQAFAEYAHKESPEGVIGLTDYEIFDQETAQHFVDDDKKALSMNEPYIFMEDVPDAAGNPRHFQTTKQKFTDTTGRLCTLGMCVDVSELVNMKKESLRVRAAYEEALTESVTFEHIAQALSSDYQYVYYIDIQTDEFTEYHSDSEKNELSIVRHDADFFNLARKDAHDLIYEKDLTDFLEAFTKENIIRELDYQGRFSLNYRQMFNEIPTWVNMKITPMNTDSDHIVVGIRDIDKQIKEEESAKRIKEERITFSRIHALTRNYIAIYSIDPATNHYVETSGSQQYDELGLQKEGDNFFAEVLMNMPNTIHPVDQAKFRSLFSKENIQREIEANGVFSLDYRLRLNGDYVFVNLNAAIVEEKDGVHLVVGVNNVDAQVKRDKEYEKNLAVAKIQANRDELTGVKNKHAYAELEAQINEEIRKDENVSFAVSVFDVNELKSTNDTHGHQAGDELLRSACMMICHAFAHSPVFRIGGDEFAIISRGYDYEHINEILAHLEEENKKNREKGKVNVAVGMARYDGDANVAAVFNKADHMMYMNKRDLKTN